MRISILAFFLLFTNFHLFAGEINISGVYKGKNLYVQNPFSGNMKDFCTIGIYVNGKLVKSNPQSSAYEIDLSFLKIDEVVSIKIIHKDDCKPKILNPQVIRSLDAFQFVSTIVDQQNISWSTKGETSGGAHYVEQFSKGSWVPLKDLEGHVLEGISNYKVPIKHHAGLNKYRVKYLSKTHHVTFSKEVEFLSDIEPVTFYPKRVTSDIYISRKVNYEILDQYGTIIKSGNDIKIDCSSLKPGFYYLNIDNITEKFLKK